MITCYTFIHICTSSLLWFLTCSWRKRHFEAFSTRTFVRTFVIDTYLIILAQFVSFMTLINVTTFKSISFISSVTYAVIANWLIITIGVFMTIIFVIFAFIYICTDHTVTSITSITNTVVSTLCIDTVTIITATMHSKNTLVYIL